MKWEPFHHPDISLPVIRRKVGDELVTLLSGTAAMALPRGASEIYGNCYPNDRAYRASVARLKKKGLVATRKTGGRFPELRLTPEGEAALPAYCTPEKQWRKPWNRWWYILMFDVPETQRHYRNTLRAFLKRMRFGCLQKSVWVTPRDVRPEYDDLDRAAAVDNIAFLFEARTVLGYGNQSVVQEAWNMEHLNRIQEHYLAWAERQLETLHEGEHSTDELVQLLRLENLAYAQAMETDPLLPEELHPNAYRGPAVYRFHRRITAQITELL